jgi:hypothetical protein
MAYAMVPKYLIRPLCEFWTFFRLFFHPKSNIYQTMKAKNQTLEKDYLDHCYEMDVSWGIQDWK